MSAILDPIWESYQRTLHALKVLRRVIADPSLASHASGPLRNTDFDSLSSADADARIDAVQKQIDDQIVLALYAAFESALRDHLISQSIHLKTHATNPTPEFGFALAAWYETWCDDGRMDHVAQLFAGVMGETLVAQVGQVRVYRNWLAHGKRGAKPPQTTPIFAFRTLDVFLSKI